MRHYEFQQCFLSHLSSLSSKKDLALHSMFSVKVASLATLVTCPGCILPLPDDSWDRPEPPPPGPTHYGPEIEKRNKMDDGWIDYGLWRMINQIWTCFLHYYTENDFPSFS